MNRFAVIIAEHRVLGYLMMPYIIKRRKDVDFAETEDLITAEKFGKYEGELTEAQSLICKLLFEFEDAQLAKLFCQKKKKAPKAFIDTLEEDLFVKQVRPFIEKRLYRCTELIKDNNINVFYKEGTANLYPSDEIEPMTAAPRTKFFFVKDEDGLRYSLSVLYNDNVVELLDKPGFILANDPCVAIVENKMYCFDDIDGKKLKPFFLRESISIPEKFEERYFETFIYNSIKKYDVEADGFLIEDIRSKPKLLLQLTENLRQETVLSPVFKYFKKNVGLQVGVDYFVHLEVNDGVYSYTKVFRDVEYESSMIALLQEKGLSIVDDSFLAIDEKQDKASYMAWAVENHSFIEDNNISFDIGEEKQLRMSLPDLKISLSEEKDWFNVNAHLHIDGFKIPFSDIRPNILKQKRTFELPDGTIAIIPEEWFAEFKDLALWAQVKDNEVRLKRVHFQALEETDSVDNSALQRLAGFKQFENYDAELPEGLNATLRSYQFEGFKWLSFMYDNNFGGCLADDMGLGKTLQTIALLQKVKQENVTDVPPAPETGQLSLFDSPVAQTCSFLPSLVVVPSSLVFNWGNEVAKFAPGMKLLKYVGADRSALLKRLNRYDIVLTTYGVLRNDIEVLQKHEFLYAVLDESQIIKNPQSKVFNAVNKIDSQYRLVITGTPIENSLTDLWSQMHFLNPDMFGSLREFKDRYTNVDEVDSLRRIISPFIMRREKETVLKDLPDLTEQVVYCKMHPEQESLYEEEMSKLRNLYLDAQESGEVKNIAFKILQGLTKLRQLANHPLLFDGDEKHSSGKFEEVCRNVESVMAHKHKVLIFSSFVKHLNLFKEYCVEQNIGYCELTGDMTQKQREKQVESFQNDEAKSIFLISLKAGGVGLNLTSADYVFILDPWWNPAAEKQAVARAHRMGQENKVFVYRYIAQDTIEEKIKALQDKKQSLADELINSENKMEISSELIDELIMPAKVLS